GVRVTRRIGQIGILTDIPLYDHIIIGDNKYFSFSESKLLTDICSESVLQEREE
ncbi:MAG: hypothetical protein K2N77_01715, partial [Lachnospiraceae bacterium]|nr:hypothetical protein [Lachnospiraceae bacterium]